MLIGDVADIYDNLVALDAVLAGLASRSVDRRVCLGDVAMLGPEPASVVRRLREVGCPTLVGNTDAWLLGLDAAEGFGADRVVGRDPTARARERPDGAALSWLRNSPPVLPIDLGAVGRCSGGTGRRGHTRRSSRRRRPRANAT